MTHTKLPGFNVVFQTPEDQQDANRYGIPGFLSKDSNGEEFVVIAFQPSYEDKQAIAAGSPIVMKIYGRDLRPHQVYTIDQETLKINI